MVTPAVRQKPTLGRAATLSTLLRTCERHTGVIVHGWENRTEPDFCNRRVMQMSADSQRKTKRILTADFADYADFQKEEFSSTDEKG